MKRLILIVSVFLTGIIHGCDSTNLDVLESRLLVARNSLTSIEISAPVSVISVDEVRALALAGAIRDSADTTDVTTSAVWTSSDNNIVTVNSQGVATGIADGTVTITATLGPLTDQFELSASSARLLQITIDGDSSLADSALLDECTSAQFTALGLYDGDEQTRLITDLVTWTQSTGNVGVFDSNIDGLLRSNNAGVAVVSASIGDIAGTFDLTVQDNLNQIVIADDGTTLSSNNSIDYTATASYSDNTASVDISDNANWTLDATFATVDNVLPDKGLVVATSTGTDTLGVTCGGESAALEINAGSATEITELFIDRDSPLRFTFAGLQTEQLRVFTRFENGTNADVTEDSDWLIVTNSNTLNLLDNSDGSKGEVTIRGAGRLVLEARYTDENNDPPQTFTSPRFEIIVDAP